MRPADWRDGVLFGGFAVLVVVAVATVLVPELSEPPEDDPNTPPNTAAGEAAADP